MEILKREFSRLVEGYQGKQPVELSILPLQYRDFAQWQHDYIRSQAAGAEAHGYWKKQVQAGFPELHLPKELNPDPRVSGEDGAAYRFVVEPAVVEKLNKMAAEHHTTIFMVTFAAYNILLSRLAGQDEVVCAIINAGRDHVALQEVVGFFVNALLVKHRVDPETDFGAFLDQVKDNVLEAFQYQDYPLELALEELKVQYPPVSAAFNMFNLRQSTQETRITDSEAHHIDTVRDIKFDMVLYVEEYQNGMSVGWNYRKARFQPQTIEYIGKGYQKLLRDIL